MKRLLWLIVLLTCSAYGQNQYYVSSSTGSDGNDGSQAHPWATINHAATSLAVGANGAKVNILAGTYNECVHTGLDSTHSGTGSGARVVFQGATNFGSIVTCSSTPTWTNGNDSTGVSGRYVDIVGMNITASGSSCSGLYDKGAFFRLIGNYIHDIPAPTSCPNSGGGAGVAVLSLGNLQPNDAHDPYIFGNIVENVGYADGQCSEMHGIYVETENSVVQANLVSRVCGFGIQMNHRTTHNVIANNTIMNILNAGILVSAADGVCNNNTTVSNNIVVNTTTAGGQIEERFGCAGSSNRYSNNVIYSNNGTAPYSFTVGGCSMSCVFNPLNLNTTQFNALFVNYTGNAKTGNYHLAGGSAAIGYGTNDNCASGGISPCIPGTDAAGNPYSNPPSAGVFESGTAPPATTASLSPASFDFGGLAVNVQSSPQTFTLTASSSGSVTISSKVTNPSSWYIIGTSSCGSTLAASASCSIPVSCKPQATGSQAGTLTVTTSASNSPHISTLSCSGVSTPSAPTGLTVVVR